MCATRWCRSSPRREGGQCRPRGPGLSGRLAVQAERAMERAGQRPARHLVVSARLRERQGARLRRDADAGPGAQPRARARMNDSPFMKDIKAKIDKAGVVVLADAWLAGAVASKKACIRKPDDIKGLKIRSAGPTFAAMWQAAGASIVSIPSQRGLQRAADRRRRRHRHQRRQLRLVPHLRAGEMHHRARRQRAVVHVRAGADVEEELRPAQQEAAGRADPGRQEVARSSSPRRARGSTTRWSRCSRTIRSRS